MWKHIEGGVNKIGGLHYNLVVEWHFRLNIGEKLFIKPAKELLVLCKDDLKLIIGLLIGHCPLKYHQHWICKTENCICRLCEGDEETSEYLVCDCLVAVAKR